MMTKDFFRTVLFCLLSVTCVFPSLAQAPRADKIIGGYFEEWGIHYGGFTIADLQKNGDGVRVTADIANFTLADIAYDSKTLRLIAEVSGTINVTVAALPGL